MVVVPLLLLLLLFYPRVHYRQRMGQPLD